MLELHEEAGAVVREEVLPVDRDTAWEHVRDLAWLGEPCEVVEEVAGERLALRWLAHDDSVVDLVLADHEDGTLLRVVETPVRALRAVAASAVAGAARGPLMLA